MLFRDLEARALEDAFHQNYPQLCAVAAQVLGGDQALAQDAVQEAWLRLSAPAVRGRIDTRNRNRLRGLLLVTVRNCARNLRRGPAAREQTIAEEGWATLPDLAPGPAEAAEQAEAIAAVRRALLALPADDHDILLLQYAQELPMAQIAAALGITEAAARQRARRARGRLKAILEQEGFSYEEESG